MKYLLALVLSGIVFQQYLDNDKLQREVDQLNSLVEVIDETSKTRRQIFNDLIIKHDRMKSKYGHMREQNYLLTRKFRKTDTKAYKKYLSKLIRDAHGIGGGPELVDKKK